jgi:DUF4097 and DUF4098 domain-containing protein YvlB
MKKFTLVSLALSLVCWVISGVMLISFGEKGFETMSQEVVGSKLIQFETKTQDLNASEVQSLDEIELISMNSSIEVTASDDNGLHVEYPSADKNSVQEKIENKKIKYDFSRYFEGSEGKLVVRLFKDHGLIHIGDLDSGKIILKVPKNIKKIKVHTQAGDLRLTALNGASVNFETASGDLRVKAANFSKVDAASASGDLRFQGYAQNLNLKTGSGDVRIQSENKSPVMNLSSGSGEVFVDFLDQPDVKITFDTGSGEIDVNSGESSKPSLKFKAEKKAGEKDEITEKDLSEAPKKHQVITLGKPTGSVKIRTGSGDARVRTVSGVF